MSAQLLLENFSHSNVYLYFILPDELAAKRKL